VVAGNLRHHRCELDGPFGSIPRQARCEPDQRAAHAVADVIEVMPLVHGSMFAPRMPTSSAVFKPSPSDERLVAEIVHPAARFHDERAAPAPRVVDAGAVGGVGADAGEAVARRTALLRSAEGAELRRVGQLGRRKLKRRKSDRAD
jgi:hypothetical protein